MKIECTIDKIPRTLHVNGSKPLNLILEYDIGARSMIGQCGGNMCGNCVVLFNDHAVLSCLIPAFKIRDAEILTFEGFRKTRYFQDIERAYSDTGFFPCTHCYASKSLILESILQQIEKTKEGLPAKLDEVTVVKEMRLNRCSCLDAHEIIDIYNTAAGYRRKRRARRQ